MSEKPKYQEIRNNLIELNELIDTKCSAVRDSGHDKQYDPTVINLVIAKLIEKIPTDYLFKRNLGVMPPVMKALTRGDTETSLEIINKEDVTSKHLLTRYPLKYGNQTYLKYLDCLTDKKLMEAALAKLTPEEREKNGEIARKIFNGSATSIDDSTPVLKEFLGTQRQIPAIMVRSSKEQQHWLQ